jgi:hypothetical protein
MRYFDSRETAITAQHVRAWGALPPAFPAVRIDGELYWDGGIGNLSRDRGQYRPAYQERVMKRLFLCNSARGICRAFSGAAGPLTNLPCSEH